MSSSTSTQEKNLSTRDPTPQEKALLDDILQLYCLNPSHKVYSHYAETAVFHDPVSIAKGKESIMSQFNGMPKIFASSETKHVSVLSSSTPKSLVVNLDQHYVFKSAIPFKSSGGAEKLMNSKLTFNLNNEGLIEEHVEEWNHEPNKTEEDDGVWGKMMEMRKKAGAKVVEKTVDSDPDKL